MAGQRPRLAGYVMVTGRKRGVRRCDRGSEGRRSGLRQRIMVLMQPWKRRRRSPDEISFAVGVSASSTPGAGKSVEVLGVRDGSGVMLPVGQQG